MKFTKASVAKIPAPDPTGKQRLVWDDELKGFGMLVSGSTSARSWVVQKMLPGGTRRRITIGAVNVLEVDEARRRAIAVLAEFAQGRDPKAERRRADKARITLRGALEQSLQQDKKLRPSSAALYRHLIEKHLKEWLDRPLRQITREMVQERHAAIAREVQARARHGMEMGHATANNTMTAFRRVWGFAAEDDWGAAPTRRLGAYAIERRERLIPEALLGDWYRAVDGLPNRAHRDFMLLLLFTGMRRNEAAQLRWEEVDFGTRTIRLPGARTKSKRSLELPMSSHVLNLLVARRALGDDRGWVFGGRSQAGHLSDAKFIVESVRERSGIAFSCHDLRRQFITAAESLDVSFLAVKLLVGHRSRDITAGYTVPSLERRRAVAQKIGDRLAELCGMSGAPEGVAQLR